MLIDAFPHIFPRAYYERQLTVSEASAKYHKRRIHDLPMLVDLDMRFRLMDQYPGYQQLLTAAGPGIENFCDPKLSPELAHRQRRHGRAVLEAPRPLRRFRGFASDEQHGRGDSGS